LSRIFDAIKNVQHAKQPDASGKGSAPPKAERRRCPRSNARVCVAVSRHNAGSAPGEEAYSANISELGGLLVMRAAVEPGETLHLTNLATQQQQECKVAHVTPVALGDLEVAIEFAQLAPDFWQLTNWKFPQESAPLAT
jgi:hypothetical protein